MSVQNVVGVGILLTAVRQKSLMYFKSDLDDPRIINTLLFITEGEAVFDIGSGKVKVGKNDIVCHRQNTVLERYPVPGKPLSYHLLHCDIVGGKGEMLSFSDLDMPFLIRVKRPGSVLRLMQRLHVLFHSGNALRLPLCSELGLQLLLRLHSDRGHAPVSLASAARPMHARIRGALDTINRQYKKRIDIPTLARKACMHPSYFSHLFKQEVGMAPHQYILNMKIAKAKDFLISLDTPLSFTGEELGFHDHSHFYRTFRQMAGMTPREFVRRNKVVYDPRVA